MDWNARPYEWVGDWSARRRSLSPDREAIVDATTGERYTYADLDRRGNRTARLLEDHGVTAADDDPVTDDTGENAPGADAGGERVAVVSRNRIEVFDLFFATGKTGGVLAPLSHRLAPRELGELLELVDPRLLVVEEPFAERVADALDAAAVDPPVLGLPDDTAGDVASAPDSEFGSLAAADYGEALPADDSPVETAAVALDDPHLLLHTGGSTGTPKETIVTHGSIAWNSFNTIASWGLRPDDVTPMVFPTFHTGGWNVISIPLFHMGGTIVIDREVEPGRVLEQIESESATLLVAVPAVLRMMADHDDWAETDLSSLRFVKSGGGPCRESVIRAWRERDGPTDGDDGVDLSQGYGLTECGPNNFAMPDGWADGPEEQVRDRVASVGKPALHVDARVVGEDGEPLPDGEIGELELAGQHAAAGYWRNPEETEAAFGEAPDGQRWVSTGDLARVDDDGFVSIEGRKKNMFVSGGENVYPPAVEDAIAEHPDVGDVIVIGIDDETWGTVGKAVVEPAAGVDGEPFDLAALEAFLEDRLARFEVPRALAFVEELPTSGPSKIDRQAVEERFGGPQ
ncbi:acyl-CoA synthetase (AMP-forming)/AMP-acid ligase II [Salinarchaeum sp. Harcht-Bsk1]|uniref:AMP-binding protein n=1 Tax=Salinarchaeum sp. Harcht-Bsk1 TaxID=1333523 RepID=UPI0003422DC7|nr:AMP-binding protein [Salinarchaeum sp. Harcht-Bsk1]AGN01281.1 acyl-CoA synthetase (AMP-forming)/AMP-acid ligase II [Salinarchaeum sp. Harcht-Bsk1]